MSLLESIRSPRDLKDLQAEDLPQLAAEIRDLLDQQVEGVVQQIIGIVNDELRAGTAHPISDDIPTLVRTLSVTTAQMLSGDSAYLGDDGDVQRGVRVLEALWLNALWGGSVETLSADLNGPISR